MVKLGPEIICLILKKKSVRNHIVELRVEGDIITMKVKIPPGYEGIKKCISQYSK